MKGHFLWMGGAGCGLGEVCFGWVGVDEHFLWVGGGGWKYFMGVGGHSF